MQHVNGNESTDGQIAQGIYMMYLYVGSILAIMCIYISLLIDQCPSLTKSRENLTGSSGDIESGSIGSFDTLKKAHISSSKTPRTSFYVRVGALGASSRVIDTRHLLPKIAS